MDFMAICLCLGTALRNVFGDSVPPIYIPTTNIVPEMDIEEIQKTSTLRMTRECTVSMAEKGQMTEPQQFKCMCDLECVKYGDCCIDFMIRFGLHTREITPPLTCAAPGSLSPFNFRFMNRKEYGYFMVATYTRRNGQVQKCNTTRFFPVSCRSSSKTYVNMECAFLNKAVDCTNWNVESECKAYTYDSTKHICTMNLAAPYFVDLRYCDSRKYRKMLSDCLPDYDNKEYIRGCSRFFYPVMGGDGKVYRNIFCYLCNRQPYGVIKSQVINDILVLTDFSDEFEKSTKTCDGKTSWMDHIMNKCRPIRCYTNKLLRGDKCEYENRTAFGHSYHMALKLDLKTPHKISFYSQMAKNIIHDLTMGLHTTNYHLTISEQICYNQSSFIYLNILFDITNENLSLQKFEEDIFVQPGLRWFLNLAIGFKINYTSVSRPYTVFKSYSFNQSLGICCSENKGLLNEDRYEPISYQINCPYIEFDKYEYDVQGVSAYISHLNTTFEHKHFSIYKERLRVCFRDFLIKINSTYSNETVEYSDTIVTTGTDIASFFIYIVCIVLSLLALFLTFITYLKFPELRTQPGKNNMALIIALFLAQMTLVVGVNRTDNTNVCPYIGIVIHYLWLSMVFWMNVCSFHMFKVFVMQSLVRSSDSRNILQSVKYSIYANGSPILIIVATVVINYILTDGKEIGYGGRACYLSSNILVAYCFVVPLALVIISNIVFFLSTVVTIQRVDQVSRGDRSGERKNVFIYIRLSVLTGVFWLVSILTNVVTGKYLQYIAIVLNASQGVFLFWSLVLNKTALSKWMRAISGHDFTTDGTSTTRQTSVSKAGTFH